MTPNLNNFTFINEKKILNIISFYLFLSSLIYLVSLFFLKFDDDYIAFLYFGERLLTNNELIWTKEFDDKFPIVQYFFLIPAYFNTFFDFDKSWGFFIFFILTFASFLIYKTANNLIFVKFIQSENKFVKEISILISSIFFYINIYTPSSFFILIPWHLVCLQYLFVYFY